MPSPHSLPDIDFATLDLLPYGIIVTDLEGGVLYYNSQEEKLSGFDRANVIGRNFFTEIAPCTALGLFRDRFTQVMHESDSSLTFNFLFPFPGNPREVRITLTSFAHQGAPLCMISVNDITEEQRVRERILSSERFREIGEVTGTVVHNFSNVLTAVRGFAELISLRGGLDDFTRNAAQSILKAGDDGMAMIERIRASMRLDSDGDTRRPERVDLCAVVLDSLEMCGAYAQNVAQRCGRTIVLRAVDVGQGLYVAAFGNELREVAVNLIRNGLDAVADMDVGQSAQQKGRVELRALRDGDWCCFQVTDNGSGMDDVVRRKLFHPLFTTKGEAGTGLGLSSSFATVQRHGGDIDVFTAPGRGSTFTVRLPCFADGNAGNEDENDAEDKEE